MSLDHTLSSLTLLEEEPWVPFFGGMISLGRSGGLEREVWDDQKMAL